MLAPRIAQRVRAAYVMAGGFAIAAVGFGLLVLAGGRYDLAGLVTGFSVLSLGLAPVVTLTTYLIIGTVPPERAGTASGMSETSTELGGALGIAVLGSIVTAIYRGAMSAAVPEGVPAEAARAARDTLGGALAVSEQLPGGLGAELVSAARDAFVQAFQLTAAINAAVALAAAVAAALLLRRVHPTLPEGDA